MLNNNQKNVILGIDPGLVKTGWGLISLQNRSISFINCGVIKTKASDSLEHRLELIFDGIQSLIRENCPNHIAMEEVFINMNPKTSQKLIMARSASYIAAIKLGYKINEYTPNTIKKNVVGSGHASKEQVYLMVEKIVRAKIDKNQQNRTLDSMDALAIAICHSFYV